MRKHLEATIPNVELLLVEDTSIGQPASCNVDGRCGADLKLTVVSPSFEGIHSLQRQRLVHVALEWELASGAIHSLPELQTLTPVEWVKSARFSWVEERLRAGIPQVEHLDITDVTNGHAVLGFRDGSKRALNPNGLELQICVVSPAFSI